MKKIISNIVFVIVIIAVIILIVKIYSENNFLGYVKAEQVQGASEFKRDNEVKYSEEDSYRITSSEFNDAMFYKTLTLEPGQSYKITCMVKTEGVEASKTNSGIGAHISIEGTTKRSIAVSGDSKWQEIELIFNTQAKEEIVLGFRLGGYLGNAKGTAWFSDFKIEEGTVEKDNKWNFASFIFQDTQVKVDDKNINIQMTQTDLDDIYDVIDRFENSIQLLSDNKIDANMDTYVIETPLNSLSYDEEFGNFVAPEDVEKQINEYVLTNDYDHIFVIIRLGNEEYSDDIQINDWIGLGYMSYYGIGYSNIRLPNDSQSYIYKFNPSINQFPEEVLIHEFLHSLERTAIEYEYEIPALHDYIMYGYRNEVLYGQKLWYADYLNKEIDTSSGKIGLPEEVFELKPPNNSNFTYAYELEGLLDGPEGIFEIIDEMF